MPSARTWREVPVTSVLCLAAIFIHVGRNPDLDEMQRWMFSPAFLEHPAYILQRPWTLFSPTLLHVDATHLILNVFWVWMLGNYIEQMWGHRWMLAIIVISGILANLAEASAGAIGVGLSGVVYGLYGWWTWQTRRDPRLKHTVQPQLDLLFVVWIPVGFLLTWLNLYPIGNWAHLGGLVTGLFLAAITPLSALRGVPQLAEEPAEELELESPDQASDGRPGGDP